MTIKATQSTGQVRKAHLAVFYDSLVIDLRENPVLWVKPTHDDQASRLGGRDPDVKIGPVAKPDDIRFAEALPKTRSGKIMRRLLKQIASGVEIKGDTTTLEDFAVIAKLTAAEE